MTETVVRCWHTPPREEHVWTDVRTGSGPGSAGNGAELALVQPAATHPRPAVGRLVDPTLFLRMAEIGDNPVDIKMFADEHGNLCEEPLLTTDEPPGQVVGCTLAAWRRALAPLQRAVGLWRLAQDGDAARLRSHLRPVAGSRHRVRFVSHPRRPPHLPLGCESFEKVYDVPAAGRRGRFDPVAAARYVAAVAVQDALAGAGLQIGAEWDAAAGKLVAAVYALSLDDAAWYQAADACWRDRVFRRCRWCFLDFDVSAGASRTDRRFCSDACRLRAFRGRKEEARRRHTAGESVKAIAAALDADVAAVRRWVGEGS